jgi:hypothetical protein
MPLFTKVVALTTGVKVDNVLAGSLYEYLPFPAYIEIGITGSATGLLATINSGPDTLMEEGDVTTGTAGLLPKYPDDFHLTDDAAVQDRLKIALRNPTGGTITANVAVRITPL